jgi:E3 ubiquitin-protein ligase SHPRH
MEEANEIIEDLINTRSSLLWQWRTKICSLLTEKLSGGDETTGEEYNKSLDTQGEAETYLQAYASLLADRKEALLNERTVLAAHEGRDRYQRKTNAARQAAVGGGGPTEALEGVELQPEYEILQDELAEQRRELDTAHAGRALKSVLVDLSGALARIKKDEDPEKAIIKDAVTALRRLLASQGAIQVACIRYDF